MTKHQEKHTVNDRPILGSGSVANQVFAFLCADASRKYDSVCNSTTWWGTFEDCVYCIDAPEVLPTGAFIGVSQTLGTVARGH